MTKEEVRARIEEIGIIPAIRTASAQDAVFAAGAVSSGGIPIVELSMTVPGAAEVLSGLVRDHPKLVIGAGTVWDVEMARRSLDAGAMFLTSTGLDLEIVELAVKEGVVVLPGALTPTEVSTAWKAGCDFVKIFPCSQVGGAGYIRALKAPLPHVKLVATGGVNQKTAGDFILAGASALGIGGDLIPQKAIQLRQADWIRELSQRFLGMVKHARALVAQP